MPRFSPRAAYNWARIYDAIPGIIHDGSTVRGGLRAWHKNGQCPDECWPYVAGYPGAPCDDVAKLSDDYPLWRYERLTGLWEVKHALHQHGAVVATVMVHEGWDAPEDNGNNIKPSTIENGWHAIMLSGYDDGRGFLVRNSWGTGWGDAGYAWLTYDDFARSRHDVWLPLLRQSWIGPIAEWFRRLVG